MRRGDNGQPVRELQLALNRFGVGPTRVDGSFGPSTENLVKQAQSMLGLTADGIVGPKTMKALGMGGKKAATESKWDRAVKAANLRYGEALKPLTGQISMAAALAIIAIESAGKGLTKGKPTIRFEVHLFERQVGIETSSRLFKRDRPEAWNGHTMRAAPGTGWVRIHTGNQNDEYAALALASSIDEEAAYKSICVGAPQILGSWHERIGYLTPVSMWQAFHVEEEQIRALFKFLETGDDDHRNPDGDLWAAATELRWRDFARQYNGPGQAATYEGWLKAAYKSAESLLE